MDQRQPPQPRTSPDRPPPQLRPQVRHEPHSTTSSLLLLNFLFLFSGYPPSATDFLYHPTTGYGLKEETPAAALKSAADSYPYGAAAASHHHHHAAYAAVYQEALVNPYAQHMTAAAVSSAMQPTQPTGKRKRKSE